MVSSLWSHLSLNFWTSYSCFLSWNEFSRKQISVYSLTDGHNTAQSTRGRLHGLSLNCILTTWSACSTSLSQVDQNISSKRKKGFSGRVRKILQEKLVVSPVQLAQPSVDCSMRVLLYSTLYTRRPTRQWNYFWEPERDKLEARSSSSLSFLKTLMSSSRRQGFL